MRTSRRLGYAFIGIGEEGGADKLRSAGARHVLKNFEDLDGFLSLLAEV